MFVTIANTPRDYAWGSTTAISDLLGTTPFGGPEAELWLGAHPASPAHILDPAVVGGSVDLLQWLERDPDAALGGWPRLPFLMKVLAAGSPLSLQAHPTAAQAREGFERENALGVPLDADHRNYRDDQPKPEIIVALSDGFEALCGFRPRQEAEEVLVAMGLAELVPRLSDIPALFAWIMEGGPEIDAHVARLAELVDAGDAFADHAGHGVASMAIDTTRRLLEAHAGDPGVLSALLLNRVTLQKGEALFLPAGNIHAYLEGLGIEVMSSSDNVLRGGLTSKHVDIPELLRVLDFAPGAPPWLHPERVSPGMEMYRPGVDDFVLARMTGDCDLPMTGPAIALCTLGSFELSGAQGSTHISRGESVYITPGELNVAVRGHGELFIATTP